MHRTLLLLSLAPLTLNAQEGDTVRLSDFGVRPYSYVNCVGQMQAAIEECKRSGARVLSLDGGRYDIWPEGALRRTWFISNTSTESECPSKEKTVGLLFDGVRDLEIDGGGATLMFHGKMTPIALEECRGVTFKNLTVDFERPGGSELTFERVNDGYADVRVHPHTRYQIVDGRMHLYGEGWRSNLTHCNEYDPQSGRFRYSEGWNILSRCRAEELGHGLVRFTLPDGFTPAEGHTLTVRDIIRDQVGWFILRSNDITLESVNMRYMHGLGIVSQYSRNITMRGVRCEPDSASGRILAASADMMHFSGCSGRVTIDDCRFVGSQDDPINVHGTNLRVVGRSGDRTLRLRFMHGQSYGFDAFFKGDTIAYVRPSSMQRVDSACVESVVRLSDREVELTLDRDVPLSIEVGRDCVENLTCTPEVVIRNCFFTRTGTRGTLVTTPRKVLIENNTYYKTGMSAILIAGDAFDWYESGPVTDVTIRGNRFVDCGYAGGPAGAVIALEPSNTIVDLSAPVHRGVRITGNTFVLTGPTLLYAKSTGGLLFAGNTVECAPSHTGDRMFVIKGCSDIDMSDNRIVRDDAGPVRRQR